MRQLAYFPHTAMNVPDAEVLRKPFNERYPFIKLTLLRSTGEKVRTRILAEARADRHAWDVVSFSLLVTPRQNANPCVAVAAFRYSSAIVWTPSSDWGALPARSA